jgi:hypothetical protein
MSDFMYQNMENQLNNIITLGDRYYIVQYSNQFIPYVNNNNFTTLINCIQEYETYKNSIPIFVKLVVNDSRNDKKLETILKNIIQKFGKLK